MSRKDESPTDPMFEPEAPDALERLDQIERRLKAARPRPPRLDVAALERLAREATVDTAVEGPAAVVIRRRPPGRDRRLWGRMAAVAGSWTCGAVVGALVMFILMSRAAPGTDSASEAARPDKQAPTPATHARSTAPDAGEKVDGRDGPSPAEKVEPLDADGGVLAMILDGFGSADSAYWPEGPTFRAGMHLVQNATDLGRVDPATGPSGRPGGDDQGRRSEATKGLKPYPHPAPAITPQRLMREVLNDMPAVVL